MWKIAIQPRWILFHALVLGATYTCFRLGIWQWDARFEADGTTWSLQNTFYAFQWWFFSAFFLWFWFKFFKDEQKAQAKKQAEKELS